jgi:hypothetical protein
MQRRAEREGRRARRRREESKVGTLFVSEFARLTGTCLFRRLGALVLFLLLLLVEAIFPFLSSLHLKAGPEQRNMYEWLVDSAGGILRDRGSVFGPVRTMIIESVKLHRTHHHETMQDTVLAKGRTFGRTTVLLGLVLSGSSMMAKVRVTNRVVLHQNHRLVADWTCVLDLLLVQIACFAGRGETDVFILDIAVGFKHEDCGEKGTTRCPSAHE